MLPQNHVFQCCCPPWTLVWVNRFIAPLKQGTWGPQGQAQGQGKGPQVPSLYTLLSTHE